MFVLIPYTSCIMNHHCRRIPSCFIWGIWDMMISYNNFRTYWILTIVCLLQVHDDSIFLTLFACILVTMDVGISYYPGHYYRFIYRLCVLLSISDNEFIFMCIDYLSEIPGFYGHLIQIIIWIQFSSERWKLAKDCIHLPVSCNSNNHTKYTWK